MPGLVPAFRVASAPDAALLPDGHAFVALLCCTDRADRIFDALRDSYVAVRARSEAPVCFVAPLDDALQNAFVDALALMPELVLTAADIEQHAPGAVGPIRQYGARWLVWVDTVEDVARAQQLAKDAGFRGSPTPIARTAAALAALSDGARDDAPLWGTAASLARPEELAALAAQRAVLVCEVCPIGLENSSNPDWLRIGDGSRVDRSGVRSLLGINEIREPCG